MRHDLTRLVDDLAGLRLLVVGDAVLDRYLEGSSDRLCREAPVANVAVSGRTDAAGGGGNVAANAAALGADVELVAVVGDDPEGDALRAALGRAGVGGRWVVVPGRRTVAKCRVVSDGAVLARFDQGDTADLTGPAEAEVVSRLTAAVGAADAVVVSDYGAGVVTAAVARRLAELQRARPRVLVVDSRRRLAAFRGLAPTAVKPNFEEAVGLVGRVGPDRVAGLAARGPDLLAATAARYVFVTLDADGGLLFEAGRPPFRTPAPPADAAHVAGAGDTYVAVVALALAAGADAPTAAELATEAAAVVVGRGGTAVCPADDLRDRLSGGGKLVVGADRLARRADGFRRAHKRVAFTNGCFDLLHRGHVDLLRRAKGLADVLVVGVNSDASVRRVKGAGRPVVPLADRLQVLAELACVDALAVFDADTSADLVRAVRPDLFVKGGTYTDADIPEAPLVRALGGEVRVLAPAAGYSTRRLIDRIRRGEPAAT